MNVLVCGGAGYIGSHMLRCLRQAGHHAVVLDDLSTGHREAVGEAELIVSDVRDRAALARVFAARRYDAVMHFCAKSLVGESVRDPYRYYDNNVGGTLNLLQAMREAQVERFVFSSSAAVYGEPRGERIDESHPTLPINPYGASKRMAERLLEDAATAYGLRAVSFRYFNAAGADASGEIGEAHEPESHLIPNALRAALPGGAALTIFGADYPTRDGTCLRDYVHVTDLADAHLLALDYLSTHAGAHCFNLGSDAGHSVREVIAAVAMVTGSPVPHRIAPRRGGDPAVLVASSARARGELGWNPRHSSLESMVASAWRWHRQPRY